MNEKIIITISRELMEVIPDYLQSMKMDSDILTQLLIENDLVQIGQMGHRIKGHGGGYGFHYISECGANIQNMAKIKDGKGVKLWIGNLKRYLNNVEVNYVDEDY